MHPPPHTLHICAATNDGYASTRELVLRVCAYAGAGVCEHARAGVRAYAGCALVQAQTEGVI
jgi:hypothetical protein